MRFRITQTVNVVDGLKFDSKWNQDDEKGEVYIDFSSIDDLLVFCEHVSSLRSDDEVVLNAKIKEIEIYNGYRE